MNENKKITQLDVATEIKPEDIIPIVQDGTNKQITKETLFAGVNDSEELNKKFNSKADKATTLKGYGITDAYTKKEVDKALENIDLADYYTKEETDAEIVFSEEEITDRTKMIIDDEEINTMGSEVTNEKSDSKFLAYSANYLKDKLVCVSPTEPENGEEVWIQKGKNLVSGFRNNQSFNVGNNSYQDDPYGFSVTDYIPVKSGKTYIFSHHLNHWCGGVHLFDENYNFLQTINADKMYDPIVISNMNCKYIIIYTWDPNNNTLVNETWMQLEEGIEVTEYEPYIDKKIYLKNDDGNYEEFINKKNMGELIVDDIKCKNLLDVMNGIDNDTRRFTYVNDSGEITFTDVVEGSGGTFPLYFEIECEPNTDYCLSWNLLSLSEGNKLLPYVYGDRIVNENLIAWTDYYPIGKQHYVFNSGPYKKLAVGLYTTGVYKVGDVMKISQLQLEKGNAATEYVPYKKFENKEVYSTSEQRIGTWIDGKPLYRKVMYSTARVEAGSGYMGNTSIPNIDVVTDVDVTIGAYGYASFKNHWTNDGGDMKISTQFDKDSGLYISADYTGFIGWILKVEYTKTTD